MIAALLLSEPFITCTAASLAVCAIGYGWCAWRAYVDGPDERLARVAVEMARRS